MSGKKHTLYNGYKHGIGQGIYKVLRWQPQGRTEALRGIIRQNKAISVQLQGRVHFFSPMRQPFHTLAGAWLTVRIGGILKI